jgi:hypothetical protein
MMRELPITNHLLCVVVNVNEVCLSCPNVVAAAAGEGQVQRHQH